jgi:hypothetical protein
VNEGTGSWTASCATPQASLWIAGDQREPGPQTGSAARSATGAGVVRVPTESALVSGSHLWRVSAVTGRSFFVEAASATVALTYVRREIISSLQLWVEAADPNLRHVFAAADSHDAQFRLLSQLNESAEAFVLAYPLREPDRAARQLLPRRLARNGPGPQNQGNLQRQATNRDGPTARSLA